MDYSEIVIKIKQETADYWKAVLKSDFDKATECAMNMHVLTVQLLMSTKDMK
jgi:hypothetical protein